MIRPSRSTATVAHSRRVTRRASAGSTNGRASARQRRAVLAPARWAPCDLGADRVAHGVERPAPLHHRAVDRDAEFGGIEARRMLGQALARHVEARDARELAA